MIPFLDMKARIGSIWDELQRAVAERIAMQELSLPMFAELTDEQVRTTTQAVASLQG